MLGIYGLKVEDKIRLWKQNKQGVGVGSGGGGGPVTMSKMQHKIKSWLYQVGNFNVQFYC